MRFVIIMLLLVMAVPVSGCTCRTHKTEYTAVQRQEPRAREAETDKGFEESMRK